MKPEDPLHEAILSKSAVAEICDAFLRGFEQSDRHRPNHYAPNSVEHHAYQYGLSSGAACEGWTNYNWKEIDATISAMWEQHEREGLWHRSWVQFIQTGRMRLLFADKRFLHLLTRERRRRVQAEDAKQAHKGPYGLPFSGLPSYSSLAGGRGPFVVYWIALYLDCTIIIVLRAVKRGTCTFTTLAAAQNRELSMRITTP